VKNYVQEGDYVEVTLPYARLSGEGVLVGSLFGVCVVDGASGASINIHTEGVYDLTAATGASTDAVFGAKAYWDNTAKKVTPVSTSNSYIGVFLAAKATTDAVARVRLNEFVA
jgi:predicted RecA/RadA family phage recombinase